MRFFVRLLFFPIHITCNDLIYTPGVNLNNKQERIIDNNAYLCYNLPLVEVLGLLERVD